MKIETASGSPGDFPADAYVLAFAADTQSPTPWEGLDETSGGLISEVLSSTAFAGKAGRATGVLTRGALPCPDLVFAGLGKAKDVDPEAWRNAIAVAVRVARQRGNSRISVCVPAENAAGIATAAVEGAILGAYRYTEFKEPEADAGNIDLLRVVTPAGTEIDAAVERAAAVAEAVCWARDLVNTPPSDKRPPALAARAEAMAAEFGLACDVLDEDRAAALGMGALLAVGQGSTAPPRVVVLEHAPDGCEGPPLVIVGKGVTFDTGGISIKPSKDMDHMKGDMGGAAAVLGAMRAIAAVGIPLRVVGVTPLAENMPDGNSYRPGDLLRAYNGKTIEVLNTDAEGRLILADALAWSCDHYSPDCVVDLATLTGACVVALGVRVAGMMTNDDELAQELDAAGISSGERVWRLPMFDEYRRLIDSPVADVKNTGGRWAGAITAAKFLETFVADDVQWAHLDIAGPSYSTSRSGHRSRGGVGFGVRLLVNWLSQRAGGS